jgi:hypothetical protein
MLLLNHPHHGFSSARRDHAIVAFRFPVSITEPPTQLGAGPARHRLDADPWTNIVGCAVSPRQPAWLWCRHIRMIDPSQI